MLCLPGVQLAAACRPPTHAPFCTRSSPPIQQVGGLEAGSRYLVRARATNACGWGPWCEPLACATSPDVPAAPAGLSAKAVGTTVRVAWEAAEDRGAAVERYELQVLGGRRGGAWAPAYAGDATSHRLQQLEANSAYSVRVRAVNAGPGLMQAGCGRLVAANIPVPLLAPACCCFRLLSLLSQLRIPPTHSHTAPAHPLPLLSAVGPGPYSAAVEVHTSKAPPSAPTNVEACAAGGGSIEVSWAAAAQSAQQAAAVSYEVEVAPEADRRAAPVRQPCPGRACSTQVAVLRGGAYRVRVRAVGADGAGHGDWSEAAKVAVQGPAPAAAAAGSAAEPAAKPQKRRGGGGDGKADKQQQHRGAAAGKTTAAKGPPKKGLLVTAARLLRAVGFKCTAEDLVMILAGMCALALLALVLVSVVKSGFASSSARQNELRRTPSPQTAAAPPPPA